MYVCRIKKNVEMQIFHVKSRGVRRRYRCPEAVDTVDMVGGGAGGGRRMSGGGRRRERAVVPTGGQDEWGMVGRCRQEDMQVGWGMVAPKVGDRNARSACECAGCR